MATYEKIKKFRVVASPTLVPLSASVSERLWCHPWHGNDSSLWGRLSMKTIQTRVMSAIAGLSVTSWTILLPISAQAVVPPSEPLIAQAKPAKPADFYKQAEKDLPTDYYTLYRIVERLARANALDRSPWRVYISPQYDINAYATQANLLAMHSGLLDLVAGDTDAIACIVGHEMAHHVQNHIPVGEAQREKLLQQARTEALEEVTAEQEDLRKDLQGMNIGGWVTGQAASLGSFIKGAGGIPGFVGSIIGGALQNQRQRRLEAAVQRIDQISKEKEEKLRQEWSALSHRHEFEADKLGYQYMVRAGFKPEGCMTVMSVLNRLPGSQTPGDSHPSPTERLAAMKALSTEFPTPTLVAEGRKNLAASPQPLTYDLSRDRVSLRINSKSGSKKGGFPE